MEILNVIEKRRSIRNIGKNIEISKDEVLENIRHAVKHTPSSFNSQSPRVMVLLDKQHESFWDLVKESLRKIVPEASFKPTELKMAGFRNGYGTILFFDDSEVTNSLIEKYALYKNNILKWSEQQNAMVQVNIWNLFAGLKIGASLQHYTEVIEEAAKEAFDIPKSWKMIAQMPFGSIEEEINEKQFIDLEKRIIVKE